MASLMCIDLSWSNAHFGASACSEMVHTGAEPPGNTGCCRHPQHMDIPALLTVEEGHVQSRDAKTVAHASMRP